MQPVGWTVNQIYSHTNIRRVRQPSSSQRSSTLFACLFLAQTPLQSVRLNSDALRLTRGL